MIFIGLVGKYPNGGIECFCRMGNIPVGVFQRVDDHLPFKMFNSALKGPGGERVGFFSGLQRGRQMIAVNDLVVAKQDRPFNAVFKLPDVSGPVIPHHHVNGRS